MGEGIGEQEMAKMDPWGTPQEEVWKEERLSSHLTRKERDDKLYSQDVQFEVEPKGQVEETSNHARWHCFLKLKLIVSQATVSHLGITVINTLLQAADQTAGITDPKKLTEMEREAVVIEHICEFRPVYTVVSVQ